jgi:hypothetical protein
MGYFCTYHSKFKAKTYGIYFQFPLWDTKNNKCLIAITYFSCFLSIPFMGYHGEVEDISKTVKAFNSLYGIHPSLSSKIHEIALSIPFMGYKFKLGQDVIYFKLSIPFMGYV